MHGRKAGAGPWSNTRNRFGASALAGSLLCFGMLACSSSTGEADKPPSQQCKDYESAYCDKLVECAASTDRSDDRDACEFSFRVYLPCEGVQSVVRDAHACIDAVDAIDCPLVPTGISPTTPEQCMSLFAE